MIIEKENFVRKDGRVLGIDYGEKRVGLALSDVTWIIASPFKILNSHGIFKEIWKIIDTNEVTVIVVGKPLPLSGKILAFQEEKTNKFINKLLSIRDIDVILWDERLSTVAAEKCIEHISLKKQKKIKDKIAASFILQGFLDYTNNRINFKLQVT